MRIDPGTGDVSRDLSGAPHALEKACFQQNRVERTTRTCSHATDPLELYCRKRSASAMTSANECGSANAGTEATSAKTIAVEVTNTHASTAIGRTSSCSGGRASGGLDDGPTAAAGSVAVDVG